MIIKSKIINEYHQSFENNLHFFWPQTTRRQTTPNLQSKLDTLIPVVKTNGNGCLSENNHQIKDYKNNTINHLTTMCNFCPQIKDYKWIPSIIWK